MRFKLVPDVTNINFMALGRMGVGLSAIAIVGAIIAWLMIGLNFGVDFKGGTTIELQTPEAADLAQVRSVINDLGVGDFSAQTFGQPNEILIQMSSEITAEGAKTPDTVVLEALSEVIPGIELRRVEFVGPKVSGELIESGIIAVVLALSAVLIYVWLRFEWQFAVGAVASLVHDLILTIGLFSLVKLEFNLSIIAALLTIVGYSLNDTVVVFDRVRENSQALQGHAPDGASQSFGK